LRLLLLGIVEYECPQQRLEDHDDVSVTLRELERLTRNLYRGMIPYKLYFKSTARISAKTAKETMLPVRLNCLGRC
jgi:hypothetical protein